MAFNRKTVKLKGRKQHPLLTAIENNRITLADIARAMSVTPQSLGRWINDCQKNKNFLLPAEQVPALAKTLKIAPAKLRPDLYLAKWRFQ